jgi:hypothetical protein
MSTRELSLGKVGGKNTSNCMAFSITSVTVLILKLITIITKFSLYLTELLHYENRSVNVVWRNIKKSTNTLCGQNAELLRILEGFLRNLRNNYFFSIKRS